MRGYTRSEFEPVTFGIARYLVAKEFEVLVVTVNNHDVEFFPAHFYLPKQSGIHAGFN
jgi:hypothetical protein